MSNWIIAAGSLVVLAVAVVIWFVLLRRYGGQEASVQLDAIRTAGTLVIGTGGAVALLLTARRQRYTELTLVHTDRDATERRITELYTKAADQLGSEQALVRLAGLYALERLAHSTVEHRQTIVDVICAYLRMPYQLPTVQGSRPEHAHQQEQQVRLTAQNILLRNLRVVPQRQRWWQRTPPPTAPTWPDIRLDLTGALLIDFSLPECHLDHVDFAEAQFTGEADFNDTQFTGRADFKGVQFTGGADFNDTQFTKVAYFVGAQFTDEAAFNRAQFTGRVDFNGTQFTGRAYFVGAQFTNGADFARAQFTGGADFNNTQFTGWAGSNFDGAQFTGGAYFTHAEFIGGVSLVGARVDSDVEPGTVWPPGWITRSAQPDTGEDPAFLYLTRAEKRPDA
ncbi:MAG: pentapeptide repeat-containing protein [Pseudonocardiaceae bacterium]